MNDNDERSAGGDSGTGPTPSQPPTRRTTALPIVTPHAIAGAATPSGIALDFAYGAFTIGIQAGAGASIALGPYEDEEVIAVWRRLGADSGLPLLLPGPDGKLEQVYPQIGRVFVGAHSDRRRLAVLSGRRPRFLAKRRATSMPRRPRIHREVEIASGLAR